jgi:hypothetical protein
MRVLLGTGVFGFNGVERRSDRYGSCRLFTKDEAYIAIPANEEIEGRKGKLLAEVLEIQPCPHPGDLMRGIAPTTPEVGEFIELGEGELFFHHFDERHEKGELERQDDEMFDALDAQFQAMGVTVMKPKGEQVAEELAAKFDGMADDKNTEVTFEEFKLALEGIKSKLEAVGMKVEINSEGLHLGYSDNHLEKHKDLIEEVVEKIKKMGCLTGVRNEPPAEVYDMVGLFPEDGRETDWLNPHMIFRAFNNVVNLYFEPVE